MIVAETAIVVSPEIIFLTQSVVFSISYFVLNTFYMVTWFSFLPALLYAVRYHIAYHYQGCICYRWSLS